MAGRLEGPRSLISSTLDRMNASIRAKAAAAAARLDAAARETEALSPLSILSRGYSVTTDSGGRVIHDAMDVSPGDMITTRLGKGLLVSRVEDKDEL